MSHVKSKTGTGHQCVNVKPGEVSYITLTNPDADFTSTTKVETVQDTDYGLEWDAAVVKQKPGELRVRLTAKARSTAKPKRKNKHSVTDSIPDGGNLTVTITSPVKPVDPVPVDYVNDTPP